MPDCVDERAPSVPTIKCACSVRVLPKKVIILVALVIDKETDETVGSEKIYTAVHICPIPRCQFAVV